MAENDLTGTVGQTSDPVSKPHSMEEMVPSTTPLTIPYFEVYRTNELEYVEYQSPYLNQGGEESGDGGDSESDSDLSDSEKTKKQQLWTALAKLLETYYPSLTKKDDWIRELINDELLWSSVAHTVNKMGNPKTRDQNYIIEQVMQLKEKASGVSRQNYKSSSKLLAMSGKALNTKKGQKIITAMTNSKVWDGKKYVDDVSMQKLGKALNTISEKYK